ncbi:hypothetical protein YN1HA_12130 [Sulfurisphaera ohwakuensis]
MKKKINFFSVMNNIDNNVKYIINDTKYNNPISMLLIITITDSNVASPERIFMSGKLFNLE